MAIVQRGADSIAPILVRSHLIPKALDAANQVHTYHEFWVSEERGRGSRDEERRKRSAELVLVLEWGIDCL